MKIGEQAIYLAQLKGMDRKIAKAELKKWFEKFEISDWWNKKVTELSKGMAQKVQFIVTVLHKPKLLIFDEPFSGFDPINANLIKDEILQLNKEGATVIFSTHRMESVEELCEYITLINKSNKILDGNLDEIKKEFKTNTFEVAVSATDAKSLENTLKLEYEIFAPTFRTIGDNLKMNIKLKSEQNSSKLINLLNKNGRLIHFKEVIPNVNEIFINSVQND
jgi:ABC-2 type transport system ATP-binding protein